MSKKSSKYQETSSIANNFSKYSLIFAFSIILAENKYIFTYLIRLSMQIVKNKYTYWKKVLRRHPVRTEERCPVVSDIWDGQFCRRPVPLRQRRQRPGVHGDPRPGRGRADRPRGEHGAGQRLHLPGAARHHHWLGYTDIMRILAFLILPCSTRRQNGRSLPSLHDRWQHRTQRWYRIRAWICMMRI